jgi:hypothetical protein
MQEMWREREYKYTQGWDRRNNCHDRRGREDQHQ